MLFSPDCNRTLNNVGSINMWDITKSKKCFDDQPETPVFFTGDVLKKARNLDQNNSRLARRPRHTVQRVRLRSYTNDDISKYPVSNSNHAVHNNFKKVA